MYNKYLFVLSLLAVTFVGNVNADNPNKIALGKWSAYPPQTISVANDPEQMAYDGENIWVVSPGSQSVTKIKARTGSILAKYTLSPWPRGITFDGIFLWITTENSNQIHKVDISNGFSVVGSYSVGNYPIEAITNKGYIWVINYNGNSVTQLSQAGTVVKTINVGFHPRSITADENFVYIASENNTITKISSKGIITAVFQTEPMPSGLSYDGSSLWYTSDINPVLIKISPNSGNVLKKINLGTIGHDTVYDGEEIWVSLPTTGYIKKIKRSNGIVIEAIKGTVMGPTRVLFDGTNIWTTFNKQSMAMKF